MRSVVHSFDNSLRQSQKLNAESDWVAFYKRIWPEAMSLVRIDGDCKMQRNGIDRIIVLPTGKQITVDEKCRSRFYGDIALEVTSNGFFREGEFIERKVGWALDDSKQCDFIAYAIPSADRCFLLPFELTKQAVRHNIDRWIARGKPDVTWPIDAQNPGYVTRSVGVAWPLLADAIKEQMHRSFGAAAKLPSFKVVGDQMEFAWSE